MSFRLVPTLNTAFVPVGFEFQQSVPELLVKDILQETENLQAVEVEYHENNGCLSIRYNQDLEDFYELSINPSLVYNHIIENRDVDPDCSEHAVIAEFKNESIIVDWMKEYACIHKKSWFRPYTTELV